MIEIIDNIKRPVKIGEKFLVPCIVREIDNINNYNLIITPIINHPHSDKENGQKEVHYHTDYRFLKHENDGEFPTIINKHRNHLYSPNIRPILKDDERIEYIVLPVINEDFKGITPVELISKSKLKYKCIHKGKCPHRGYDLSQVKPINGVITCPLHSLKFNEKDGSILL